MAALLPSDAVGVTILDDKHIFFGKPVLCGKPGLMSGRTYCKMSKQNRSSRSSYVWSESAPAKHSVRTISEYSEDTRQCRHYGTCCH